MKTIKYKKDIDIDLYVVSQILFLLKSLLIPKKYAIKLNNIQLELDNELFKRPKKYQGLDCYDEKWEVTSYLEEYIPKNKREEN